MGSIRGPSPFMVANIPIAIVSLAISGILLPIQDPFYQLSKTTNQKERERDKEKQEKEEIEEQTHQEFEENNPYNNIIEELENK